MKRSCIDYDSVAEIYDLYVTADYDVRFFLAETAGVDGPILELAAGTGRLSLPLAGAGRRLTCLDVSQGMLDVLARKLDEQDLSAEVLCADVCDLRASRTFAQALFPFQAFMEIVGEDRQRAALAAIYSSLEPGGRFVCTLHNPPVRRAHVDGTLRVIGRFPAVDGTLVVSGFELGGRPVVERLQFFEMYGTDNILRWKRMQPMTFELIERDRFASMVENAGFRVVDLYGSYDRSAFDDDESPVMIWVLEKVPRGRGSPPTCKL